MPGTRGFVYATSGADYTTLARRSARNLRAVMPRAQIDLYTDQAVTDPVFNRIFPLNQSWFRPKMEALIRSRFDRTVYLDADTIALADVSELFRTVDRCDLAACPSFGRPAGTYLYQTDIPRSFPYLTAGMIVIKPTARLIALIREWEHMVRVNDTGADQAALRRLLHDRRLPFQVIPYEYNLINLPFLDISEGTLGAPRILHVCDLHKSPPGDAEQPFDLDQAIGPARAAVIRQRQEWERKTKRRRKKIKDMTGPIPAPDVRARLARAGWAAALRRLARRLRNRLRRPTGG